MICVESQQEQILKTVYTTKQVPVLAPVSGILSTVLMYTVDQVEDALGVLGVKLRAFAEDVNLEHPGLETIFNGLLSGNEERTFSRDACDLLNLCVYGRSINASDLIIDSLQNSIEKHQDYHDLIVKVNRPDINLLNIRFLPTRSERDRLRGLKREQFINVSLWLHEFDCLCSDFIPYKRWSNPFQRDLIEAKKRLDHFSNLGLRMMADEINRSISRLNLFSEKSQYYGFNKILLNNASKILGKLCNCSCFLNAKTDGKVFMFDTQKLNYKFLDEGGIWRYACRLHTYEEVKQYASVETHELVNHLENFPELGGNPLFDNYRVLVPVLDCFESRAAKFLLPDGSRFHSESIYEAQTRLSMELIKQKETVGLLLGEKDEGMYFIGYFRA